MEPFGIRYQLLAPQFFDLFFGGPGGFEFLQRNLRTNAHLASLRIPHLNALVDFLHCLQALFAVGTCDGFGGELRADFLRLGFNIGIHPLTQTVEVPHHGFTAL